MRKNILRSIAILLVLFICTALLGCDASFDESTLVDKSEAYAQNMAEGDFIPLMEDTTTELSQMVTAESLREAWMGTTANMGDFEDIQPGTFSQNGNEANVDVICGFTNTNLQITFTYDSKGRLGGLWMTYVAKPIAAQSTDAYEETAIEVAEQSPLAGMLTMPKESSGDVPAVVLIAGSGANDMDETLGAGGNKALADLAHGLAERGIASIRYNKRTYEYPSTDIADVTIEYEVLHDASAAYALLAETPGVNANRIYIVGHSLGGMMAPKIAQDTGAAGFVSLAGSPRPLQDISLDQNEAAIASAGISETEQQLASAQVLQQYEAANDAKQGDETVMLGFPGAYWYSLNQIDIPAITQSLTVPMLFMQGAADFQVGVETDFAAWQELLADNNLAAFKLYDGLNHLFMPSSGIGTVEEYNAPSHVDSQVIDDIAAWIG